MSNSELYTIDKILDDIIEIYKLDLSGTDARKKYQQKIYRTLHNTKIWDKGIIKKNGKKEIRYFSEQQKQELLCSSDLYDYVRNNSESDKIKNSMRYKDLQEEIAKRRESYISYLDSQEQIPSSEGAPYISQEEYESTKNSMMLTAIFEHFFTPINDSLLENDLYKTLFVDGLGLTNEVIEAEQRLNNPKGSYFKEIKIKPEK